MLARVILVLLILILLAGIGYLGHYAWETRQRLNATEAARAAAAAELAELEAERAAQERYLERLRNDPEYLERAIRQTLGYVREGDIRVRFEEGPELMIPPQPPEG